MKPSISSGFFSMLDAYEMVKAFQEAGYNHSEINEVHYKPFMRKEKMPLHSRSFAMRKALPSPRAI